MRVFYTRSIEIDRELLYFLRGLNIKGIYDSVTSARKAITIPSWKRPIFLFSNANRDFCAYTRVCVSFLINLDDVVAYRTSSLKSFSVELSDNENLLDFLQTYFFFFFFGL